MNRTQPQFDSLSDSKQESEQVYDTLRFQGLRVYHPLDGVLLWITSCDRVDSGEFKRV